MCTRGMDAAVALVMEKQSMQALLWSVPPRAHRLWTTIEGWDRTIVGLIAHVWQAGAFAWHQMLQNFGKLARLGSRYLLLPPHYYRLKPLAPRHVPRPMTLIPRLPAPDVRVTNAKAPVTRGTSLVSADDDEATVIDHFISPSARVIDERSR